MRVCQLLDDEITQNNLIIRSAYIFVMENRVPELAAVSSDFDGGAVAARGAVYTTAMQMLFLVLT